MKCQAILIILILSLSSLINSDKGDLDKICKTKMWGTNCASGFQCDKKLLKCKIKQGSDVECSKNTDCLGGLDIPTKKSTVCQIKPIPADNRCIKQFKNWDKKTNSTSTKTKISTKTTDKPKNGTRAKTNSTKTVKTTNTTVSA